MTKESYMPRQKTTPERTVTWRAYQGSRKDIAEQLAAGDIPVQWGKPDVVAAYVMDQIPLGDTWAGSVRVTGYKTPPNDNGTGTAYVSVHWETGK